ncbi:LacI family DNA-binding transcriptional regulator [Rhizobium sp. 2MFCol3.1]|uniref:LacI family DNA-binding transcriptional regulator n=1 Tax=Rhizobium sp. 2MFCol3.1 TaxID=1246459 RepID=UPI00036E64F7|nr:LacI family DNA-binding transcriptional regulator [Rhizobium sp. 2MFCol3.1]
MKSKSSRASHEAIALAADVSVSTVDRVLNERGGVTEEKARRVVQAAAKLGFVRVLPEIWHTTKRIEVILPKNSTPFWQSLDEAFVRHGAALPRHYVLQRTHLRENDVALWRRAILNPAAPRAALIIAADAGAEMAPALQEVMDRGEIVATLTTEIPGLSGHTHSGIDNVAAGRTAGKLMAGLLRREGVLAVLPPHERRVEHTQRIEGFRQMVADRFEVQVHPTYDRNHRLSSLVTNLLDQQGVVGVYDTGHDSVEIGETLRRRADRPVWIAHEKSSVHQLYLKTGILDFVLDQDPDRQASHALLDVLKRCQEEKFRLVPVHRPELRIYCSENL